MSKPITKGGMQFSIEVPETLPLPLIEAFHKREVVLFAGSGLSTAAGYPPWEKFVQEFLDWEMQEKLIDPKFGQSLAESIENGEADYAVDSLASQAKNANRMEEVIHLMRKFFLEPHLDLTPIHAALAKLPFAGAVTPNYDDLLERTFEQGGQRVYTSSPLNSPEELDKLQLNLKSGAPFLLKLYGSLVQPETVLLSSAQYNEAVYNSQVYADFFSGLFQARTFLFLGASLDEILRSLEPTRITRSNQEHFAFIEVGEPSWQSKADLLRRRYGINVFTFQREYLERAWAAAIGSSLQDYDLNKQMDEKDRMMNWFIRQALPNMLSIQDEGEKALALVQMARTFGQGGDKEGLLAILEAVHTIQVERQRALALTGIADVLGQSDLQSEAGQAISEAISIGLRNQPANENQEITSQMMVVFADASDIPNQAEALAWMVIAMALVGNVAGLQEVFRAAGKIQDSLARTVALASIARGLVQSGLQARGARQAAAEALQSVQTIESEEMRVAALIYAVEAQVLVKDQGGLQKALAIARSVQDDAYRADALLITGSGQARLGDRTVLQETLSSDQVALKDEDKISPLILLSQSLAQDGILAEAQQAAIQALTTAQNCKNEELIGQTLAQVAEIQARMGDLEGVWQTLSTAHSLKAVWVRVESLAEIAIRLVGAGLQAEAKQPSDDALANILDEGDMINLELRAYALGKTIPALRLAGKPESLSRALDALLAIFPGEKTQMLTQVVVDAAVFHTSGPSGVAAFSQTKRESTWLKKVILKNIGPFENLELELDRNWNVLLGDNGVGKSNIIKAIALGILGRDGLEYADRLIRFGATNAQIILETNEKKQYFTELSATSSGVDLRVTPAKLIDAENWLVVGFPPARTVTWQKLISARLDKPKVRTVPDDLLPLISGLPDPRLDQVKQGYINIDHRIKTDPDSPYKDLLSMLDRSIQTVTSGMKVVYKRVDLDGGKIIFDTDDGEVPLDAVSQGTASLIGWVGFLTQRLFEFYRTSKDASNQYGLVLIDEIDAHMHPAWQQQLVRNLKVLFPKVQFVATTHSPLIPISSGPNEVVRLRRQTNDAGGIVLEKLQQDLRRWRADQVLTSFLFDLDSTMDPQLFAAMERYTELAAKDNLTPKEQEELNQKAELLKIPPPSPLERETARLAFDSIEASLEEKLKTIPLEKQQKVIEEAKVQLQEMISGTRRSS